MSLLVLECVYNSLIIRQCNIILLIRMVSKHFINIKRKTLDDFTNFLTSNISYKDHDNKMLWYKILYKMHNEDMSISKIFKYVNDNISVYCKLGTIQHDYPYSYKYFNNNLTQQHLLLKYVVRSDSYDNLLYMDNCNNKHLYFYEEIVSYMKIHNSICDYVYTYDNNYSHIPYFAITSIIYNPINFIKIKT